MKRPYDPRTPFRHFSLDDPDTGGAGPDLSLLPRPADLSVFAAIRALQEPLRRRPDGEIPRSPVPKDGKTTGANFLQRLPQALSSGGDGGAVCRSSAALRIRSGLRRQVRRSPDSCTTVLPPTLARHN